MEPDEPQFDEHLIRLYHVILELMKQELGVNDPEIVIAEETVRQAFRYDLGHDYGDIDFTLSENLCAEFYRMFPLSTSQSRFVTSHVLRDCPRFGEVLTSGKSELNVVSLGGGYGADVVGFCSALQLYRDVVPPVHQPQLKMLVMDQVQGWKKFLKKILEQLKRDDYGDISSMFQDLPAPVVSFLGTDVRFPRAYLNTYLHNADIVIVKSLLSIVRLSDTEHIRRTVADNMKAGSLLLLMDSNDYDFSRFGLQIIYHNNFGNMDFYNPNLQYPHLYGCGLVSNARIQASVYVKPATQLLQDPSAGPMMETQQLPSLCNTMTAS